MSHSNRPRHHLSKSKFTAGMQCAKRLWWQVQEPDAPELVSDTKQQAVFDQGHRVGELARTHVPGGVLIDFPHYAVDEKVAATASALASGAPVIYEASFVADSVFVAVDILEKRGNGYVLSEVKSTLGVKEQHIPDVAIQVHVARRAGVAVEQAEVMHLNRECRHPDLSNLFVRADVTPQIAPDLRDIPGRIDTLLSALAGPLPDVAIGPHCSTPYECPFQSRCWPAIPEHHVSTLYRISAKKLTELAGAGIQTIHDLPDDFEMNATAMRQVRSVRRGDLIVEPGLRRALARLSPPIAFLDFETIAPAVPVWPGCRPFGTIPVQFSCHTITPTGLRHDAWLADGPDDPREEIARALIAACAHARTVLVYNETFERGCIRELASALPHLAPELTDLAGRLRDLLPIVRNHVYHPDFGGGFSIKVVLPALIPGLGYEDLEIQDGGVASTLLTALLLDPDAFSEDERRALRDDLLMYCERDTMAMVRLFERLQEL